MNLPSASPEQITLWLEQWQQGNSRAGNQLAEGVFPDLHRIAARYLQAERADNTLEPGALVNELWLRLTEATGVAYHNRAHFFALAATTMRRILVDHARARQAEKRGGDQNQVSLTAVEGWNPAGNYDDLMAFDQALQTLEDADPRAARVVELRFFGGLAGPEIAEVLGTSEITVKRDWKVARAWLMQRLQQPS